MSVNLLCNIHLFDYFLLSNLSVSCFSALSLYHTLTHIIHISNLFHSIRITIYSLHGITTWLCSQPSRHMCTPRVEPSPGVARSKQPSLIWAQRWNTGGAAVVACEVVWLKRMLKDLGIAIKDLIPLLYENMRSIHLARNLVFHTCAKHIDVHYHIIRERV